MIKKINLPAPYELQEQIENDPHRFRIVSCGRRWGKSFMALREAFNMIVRNYIETGKKQRGWIVAPTFPLVREDWMIAEEMLKDAITDKKQTEMRMDFSLMGFLEFKSAEREDEGLRGAGLDCCVIDEAARVSQKSWEQGIRPSLADKQGRAIFISTPKGRNYFFDLFRQGQEVNPEIKSWQYPTYTNPYFPMSEWETIKRTTPEMILKQEYMADFLEDEAAVFKNLSHCYRGSFEEPIKNEYYTIGIDLGRTEDFTVITVIKNSNAQVVYVYRQNKIDWALQKEQIKAITQKYERSIAWIDSTGLGDPIEEDLKRSGVNTKDYKFSNSSKQVLVEQLIVAIEQGLIGLPVNSETNFLIEELKSFSYEILSSGRVRYEAPAGLHDDGVMSLGLAVMGISHLLHKKEPQAEVKKTLTADDWERFYQSIEKGEKKYGSRERVMDILKTRRLKRILTRPYGQ